MPMQREGLIRVRADIDIRPGEEREQKISHFLNSAPIILLLISSNFMKSDRCYKEMMQAMERHEHDEACVVPIIVKPVNWPDAPYGKLQALPRDAKPRTRQDREEAFMHIATEIRQIVREVLTQRNKENGDDHEHPDPVVLRTNFDHLIETHTQLFAGREEIIDTIHNHIDENPRGYIFIEE